MSTDGNFPPIPSGLAPEATFTANVIVSDPGKLQIKNPTFDKNPDPGTPQVVSYDLFNGHNTSVSFIKQIVRNGKVVAQSDVAGTNINANDTQTQTDTIPSYTDADRGAPFEIDINIYNLSNVPPAPAAPTAPASTSTGTTGPISGATSTGESVSVTPPTATPVNANTGGA